MPRPCKFHLHEVIKPCWCWYDILFSLSAVGWLLGVRPAEQKILSLFFSHRDGQLVFLTEQERAGLAQVNPCSSEPSDSSLLDRLFSTNISSVYRLGKRQAVRRSHIGTEIFKVEVEDVTVLVPKWNN